MGIAHMAIPHSHASCMAISLMTIPHSHRQLPRSWPFLIHTGTWLKLAGDPQTRASHVGGPYFASGRQLGNARGFPVSRMGRKRAFATRHSLTRRTGLDKAAADHAGHVASTKIHKNTVCARNQFTL